MESGLIVGFVGLAVGLAGVVRAEQQSAKYKRQGTNLLNFLRGLKAATLPESAVNQINDMMDSLKE